jgi:hypothetical protein
METKSSATCAGVGKMCGALHFALTFFALFVSRQKGHKDFSGTI